MVDENVLICIFNYRHDDNARRWKRLLNCHFRTIVLDSGNDKVCDDFIQYPNIYYSGLWNEMKRYSEMGNYAWVGIICSDVEIDDENLCKLIDRIKWLKTTKNVGVWQPSADKTSKSWLGYNNGTSSYEAVGLLEGWMLFVRSSILWTSQYIDVNKNLYGWGIDNEICRISTKVFKMLNLRDNYVIVHHSPGTGYSVDIASNQGQEYLNDIAKNYNISIKYFVNQHNEKYDANIIYNDTHFNFEPIKYLGNKEHPVFVTMTSWKNRIQYVPLMLENLKKQTHYIDKVVLWLSSDELSMSDIPKELIDNDYVDIKWVDKNLYVWKRYLTMYQYPNAYIVVMDDDFYYYPEFIDRLFLRMEETKCDGPVCICCNYCNDKGQPWGTIDTGKWWIGGGVTLWPPYTFPEKTFTYYWDVLHTKEMECDEAFMMPFLIHDKTPIYKVDLTWKDFYERTKYISDSQNEALCRKFFTTGWDTKTNKKNQLSWDICQELPIEYYNSYKEAFPNFGSDIEVKDRIIISMTTWSGRIKNLPIILDAVMANTKLPDKIVINVSIEDFPNGYESFPKEVMVSINKYKSILDIHWLKHNTKVWKKLIPTLLRYNSDNDIIISIDDDFKYPNDFIETLYNDYVRYGKKIPVSGNKVVIDGIQYHCGCCSLTKYAFFKDNLGLLTEDVYKAGSSDIYYTTVVNRGGRNYKTSSNLYFTNMPLISSDDIGYSVSNKINLSNAISTCSEVRETDYTYNIIDYICESAVIKYEKKNDEKKEEKKSTVNNIEIKKVSSNFRILCLIEDSVPYYAYDLQPLFSKYFDTRIVDCKERRYSLCYSKLPELSEGYDYVLLIKTNVSFSWANRSYVESIANGAIGATKSGNVGVWGVSNNSSEFRMSNAQDIVGDIAQDQIVLLNSKVIQKAKKLDFSNNFIGAGYIDYLCKVSKSLDYKNLINKRIPLRLYSNIEDFDNNSIISLRNAFNKLNNIS